MRLPEGNGHRTGASDPDIAPEHPVAEGLALIGQASTSQPSRGSWSISSSRTDWRQSVPLSALNTLGGIHRSAQLGFSHPVQPDGSAESADLSSRTIRTAESNLPLPPRARRICTRPDLFSTVERDSRAAAPARSGEVALQPTHEHQSRSSGSRRDPKEPSPPRPAFPPPSGRGPSVTLPRGADCSRRPFDSARTRKRNERSSWRSAQREMWAIPRSYEDARSPGPDPLGGGPNERGGGGVSGGASSDRCPSRVDARSRDGRDAALRA